MTFAALLLGLLAGPAPPQAVAQHSGAQQGVAQQGVAWKTIEPGLELAWVEAKVPSPVGDSRIAVLRIDPCRWQLELAGRTMTGEPLNRNARRWATEHDFVAVINAGMFAGDHTTHLGYLETRGKVHVSQVNDYRSVAAFDPHDPATRPRFRIFDLDEPGVTVEGIRKIYGSLVQNLRLIKKPGTNRWGSQSKKWSEAALGEDKDGKILFVFSRSPFSMRTLNHELLGAGIDLVALQHLEGGPEAQLYIHTGDFELELVGSFETAFWENDGNGVPWPIPNVLGIRSRPP